MESVAQDMGTSLASTAASCTCSRTTVFASPLPPGAACCTPSKDEWLDAKLEISHGFRPRIASNICVFVGCLFPKVIWQNRKLVSTYREWVFWSLKFQLWSWWSLKFQIWSHCRIWVGQKWTNWGIFAPNPPGTLVTCFNIQPLMGKCVVTQNLKSIQV